MAAVQIGSHGPQNVGRQILDTDYLTIENFPPQEGISDLFGWKFLPDGRFFFAVEIVK